MYPSPVHISDAGRPLIARRLVAASGEGTRMISRRALLQVSRGPVRPVSASLENKHGAIMKVRRRENALTAGGQAIEIDHILP